MYSQLPAFLLCSSPQPFLSSGLYHTFQSLFIPKPLINTLPGSLPADLQVFRQRRCEQNLSLAASFFSYCLFIVQPSAPFNIYLPSSLQYFVFVSCSWFFCHLSPPIITDTCSFFPPLSYKVKFCFIFWDREDLISESLISIKGKER